MASRAVASTVKAHLPTLSTLSSVFSRRPILALQSRNYSIEPLAQSVGREAEAEKGKAEWPGCLLNRAKGRQFVTSVAETKCTSEYRLFEKMQLSTANDIDLSRKPKPFVRRVIRDEQYFTAVSLEEDDNFSPEYNIYPPFPSQNGFFFACSCNGLFCFENDEREILLSNPTTNEFKILPRSFELPPGVSNYNFDCVIWFDHKSEDYKVMFLVLADFEDEEGECLDVSFEIDLYSLKSNSWKKIPCTGFSFCGPLGACINGVYYCVAGRKGKVESTRVILSFDFSTETISSLPLPDVNKQCCYLLEYNGLLSILAYSVFEVNRSYELWVMNESWARESIFHTSGVQWPVIFWKKGELLCFESFNHELLVFDRATGKLKDLGICIPPGARLFPFVESSVRLRSSC